MVRRQDIYFWVGNFPTQENYAQYFDETRLQTENNSQADLNQFARDFKITNAADSSFYFYDHDYLETEYFLETLFIADLLTRTSIAQDKAVCRKVCDSAQKADLRAANCYAILFNDEESYSAKSGVTSAMVLLGGFGLSANPPKQQAMLHSQGFRSLQQSTCEPDWTSSDTEIKAKLFQQITYIIHSECKFRKSQFNKISKHKELPAVLAKIRQHAEPADYQFIESGMASPDKFHLVPYDVLRVLKDSSLAVDTSVTMFLELMSIFLQDQHSVKALEKNIKTAKIDR